MLFCSIGELHKEVFELLSLEIILFAVVEICGEFGEKLIRNVLKCCGVIRESFPG